MQDASLFFLYSFWLHMPTHEVALKAVTMAVATDAMICTIHLMVSFFVIIV